MGVKDSIKEDEWGTSANTQFNVDSSVVKIQLNDAQWEDKASNENHHYSGYGGAIQTL